MNGDNRDGSTKAIPSVSLFRGIYNRVAKRLGVDPSYVSRVARGERKSAAVEQALAEEVRLIRDHLNDHLGNRGPDGHADGHGTDGYGVDGHGADGHGADGHTSGRDGAGGRLDGSKINPARLDRTGRGDPGKTKRSQATRTPKP
jgi:hypothetical protein